MKHTLSFSKATFAASAFKYQPRACGRFGVVNTAWASLLGRTRSGYSSVRRRLAWGPSVTVLMMINSSSAQLPVVRVFDQSIAFPPLGECGGLRLIDHQIVDLTQSLDLNATTLSCFHV